MWIVISRARRDVKSHRWHASGSLILRVVENKLIFTMMPLEILIIIVENVTSLKTLMVLRCVDKRFKRLADKRLPTGPGFEFIRDPTVSLHDCILALRLNPLLQTPSMSNAFLQMPFCLMRHVRRALWCIARLQMRDLLEDRAYLYRVHWGHPNSQTQPDLRAKIATLLPRLREFSGFWESEQDRDMDERFCTAITRRFCD